MLLNNGSSKKHPYKRKLPRVNDRSALIKIFGSILLIFKYIRTSLLCFLVEIRRAFSCLPFEQPLKKSTFTFKIAWKIVFSSEHVQFPDQDAQQGKGILYVLNPESPIATHIHLIPAPWPWYSYVYCYLN